LFIAFAHEGNSESRETIDKIGVGLDNFFIKDVFFAGIFLVGVKAIKTNGDTHMTPAQGEAEGVSNNDAEVFEAVFFLEVRPDFFSLEMRLFRPKDVVVISVASINAGIGG